MRSAMPLKRRCYAVDGYACLMMKIIRAGKMPPRSAAAAAMLFSAASVIDSFAYKALRRAIARDQIPRYAARHADTPPLQRRYYFY